MAEAFLNRIIQTGGGGEDTVSPTVTVNGLATTLDTIEFTVTNNDTSTVDMYWELSDDTPDANTLSLASGATSTAIVVNGLSPNTTYSLYVYALASGKGSSIPEVTNITTDILPSPTIAQVDVTDSNIDFTLTNNASVSADVLYHIGVTPPTANTEVIAANTTSGTLSLSGLTELTTYTLYAQTSYAGSLSTITSHEFTTIAGAAALILTIESAQGNSSLEQTRVDASGNIIGVGYIDAGTYNSGYICKLDSDLTMLNEAYVRPTSQHAYLKDVVVNAAGNYVAIGHSSNYGSFIIEFSSTDLSIVLDKKFLTSNQTKAYKIAIDSSGDYIVACQESFNIVMFKLNSSFEVTGKRHIDTNSETDYQPNDIAFDSTGNVYVAWRTNNAGLGGSGDIVLLKLNSALAPLADIAVGTSLGTDNPAGVVIDSLDNIYLYGTLRFSADGAGGYDYLLAKFNTSLTLQSSVLLGTTSDDTVASGDSLTLDSNGDLVITGYTSITGDARFYLAKLDNNLTLTSDLLVGDTGSNVAYSVVEHTDGSYIVCGTSTGTTYQAGLFLKIPGNLALAGTSQTLGFIASDPVMTVVASPTFTVQAVTLTFTVPTTSYADIAVFPNDASIYTTKVNTGW